MTIINEERNYRELKESIKMMKGQEDEKIILSNLLSKKLRGDTKRSKTILEKQKR